MLDVKKKETRVTRSFTLKPSNIALIEELAESYGSNASRIVEALVETYGPKIKQQLEARKA
jgi:hypothetical protein